MTPLRAAALAALLGGVGLLAWAGLAGELHAGFLLIIPYVAGSGWRPFVGMLLLMAAAFLWFLANARETLPASRMRHLPEDPAERRFERRHESRHGGVVLLGPLPIVWGSDRRILPWMIAAGALLLLLGLAVALL